MATTKSTLLERVKNRNDNTAWREFHRLYAPILYRYARVRGLSRDDALEVRDECLKVLAMKMPGFDYVRAKGGFQAWLRRMVHRKTIDFLRKRRIGQAKTTELRRLPDRNPTPEDVWEECWQREHLKYCVNQVRPLVPEKSFRVFRMLMLDDCSVREVCAELGVNTNQVYKAKSLVLKAVRMKMAELGLGRDL